MSKSLCKHKEWTRWSLCCCGTHEALSYPNVNEHKEQKCLKKTLSRHTRKWQRFGRTGGKRLFGNGLNGTKRKQGRERESKQATGTCWNSKNQYIQTSADKKLILLLLGACCWCDSADGVTDGGTIVLETFETTAFLLSVGCLLM